VQGERIGRGGLKFPVIVWRKEERFTLRTPCFVESNTVLRILHGWPQDRARRVGEEKQPVPVRNPKRVVRPCHATGHPNSQINKDVNVLRTA
jgi:hypothetical protein